MRFVPGRNVIVLAMAAASAVAAPAAAQQAAVASAVVPEALGAPPGEPARQLVIGQRIVRNERIVTGPTGQTQMLFPDEAAITIGPNSELTVDEFLYDPATAQGRLQMSATQGVMRFVGGRLSKTGGAVSLRTPAGVIGVRGGIFVAKISRDRLDVLFLYGDGLSVTNNNITQTITRPGLVITVSGIGASPSPPGPAPGGMLGGMLGQLSGRPGAPGGAGPAPTDASVVNSHISAAASDNLPASVRQAGQAGQAAPPSAPPPPAINPGAPPVRTQLNTVANQPVVVGVQPTLANPGLPRP